MTKIEWTDETWNPIRGCSRVSRGCGDGTGGGCYAERFAARFSAPGQPYEGLVRATPNGPRWTGEVRFVPEHLADPLRWRKPRRVFVNSMSDLFHEKVTDEQIAAVFGVMDAAPQHTFQILTKRPERMRAWFAWVNEHAALFEDNGHVRVCALASDVYRYDDDESCGATWPLPNVWLGVSVEDQRTADERIPLLLETPAAVRFVSYEPALGPVDFTRWDPGRCDCESCSRTSIRCTASRHPIDWVIAGSESGPGARAAELDWFRSVRDQCAAAGVPYFFKQWVGDHALREPGSLGPGVMRPALHRRGGVVSLPVLDDRQHMEWPR